MKRVKMGEPIVEHPDEIIMPEVNYKQVAYIDKAKKFSGRTLPIPSVLIEYLNDSELKAFSFIFKQIRESGHCMLKVVTMSNMMCKSIPIVAGATKRLQEIGLIYYETNGHLRDKQINFEAIQKLEDFLVDLKPGAAAALRKEAKNTKILKIPEKTWDKIAAKYSYRDENEEEYD